MRGDVKMKKEINEEIIETIKRELDLKEEENLFNKVNLVTEIYNLGYHKGRIQCFNLAFGNKQRRF